MLRRYVNFSINENPEPSRLFQLPDCPSCGDSYEQGSSFCSYCGYALSLKSSLPAEPDGSVGACKCESRDFNKEKARFCRSCGNSLLVREPENNLTDSWQSSLSLDRDEKVLETWEAGQKEIKPLIYGDFEVLDRGEGVLVLTSHTLIWLHRILSSERSSYSRGFRIPLEKIMDLSFGADPVSHLAITDDQGVHVISPFSQRGLNPGYDGLLHHRKYMTEDELRNLHGFLAKQRTERRFAVFKEKERVQVIVDFSFLRDYMERGGIIVQKISCAHCGASMPLPEKGDTVNCPYCKTPHKVQDVFERVKQLIG